MAKVAANSKRTAKRAPTPASWKPGESGNPKGAPKRGESWAEVIRHIGNLTPKEAAEYCRSIASTLAQLGDAVTLKEAVVLRVFTALIVEPSAGLLNTLMDRAEGKLTSSLNVDMSVRDWREYARARSDRGGSACGGGKDTE